MEKIVNIAIIGCGRVAGHHVRAINKNPQLKLVAVSDLSVQRMKDLPGAGQVPHYENYHNMMDNHPEIDTVAIITPSGMHFEHALDIVSLYKKHVVIEKPVVMTLEQGRILEEAASNSFVQIFPVHQYRFNRCVQRIRKAIFDQELGQIQLATVRMRWCRSQAYYDRDPWRGTFAMDGGCCTNQGIHHLDLLRYLNGEVKRVNAIMKTFGSKIEVEDTVVASIEFENGAFGSIEITTAARPCDFESSLSVIGSKGLAMLGGSFTDKLIEFSPEPQETLKCSDSFEDAYGLGHNDIYSGVFNAITKRAKPAVEFHDAMNTMKFLHAMYVSAENNSWINIDEGISSPNLGRHDDTLSQLYRAKRESK